MSDDRQHAPELIDRLSALVGLLETIVDPLTAARVPHDEPRPQGAVSTTNLPQHTRPSVPPAFRSRIESQQRRSRPPPTNAYSRAEPSASDQARQASAYSETG